MAEDDSEGRRQWAQDRNLAGRIKSAAQDALRAELIKNGMDATRANALAVQVKQQNVITGREGVPEPHWVFRMSFDTRSDESEAASDKREEKLMAAEKVVHALRNKIHRIKAPCHVRGYSVNTNFGVPFDPTPINLNMIQHDYYFRPVGADLQASPTGDRTGDYLEEYDALTIEKRRIALIAHTEEDLIAGLNTVLSPENQINADKLKAEARGQGEVPVGPRKGAESSPGTPFTR